jgi:hypothetical protein
MVKASIQGLDELSTAELAFALGNALALRDSAKQGALSTLAEYYGELASALYFESRRRGIDSDEADCLMLGNPARRTRAGLN